jgi:large subunit ribosomal protein L18
MNRLITKNNNAKRRENRVRTALKAVSSRPRLSVDISNRHISAQIIDDKSHTTLVFVTTAGQPAKGNMTERAVWVGKEIAKKSKAKKIAKVTFDRGQKLYHGRIKALADSAREEGLVI